MIGLGEQTHWLVATNSNEDGSDERTFPKCYAFAILASERGLPALL
jgi:hypothetical protein